MIFLQRFKKYNSQIVTTKVELWNSQMMNNKINCITSFSSCICYLFQIKSYGEKYGSTYVSLNTSDHPDMFPLDYSMSINKKTILKIKKLRHHRYNKRIKIIDVQLLNCAKEIMVIHIDNNISKNRLRFIINDVYAKGTIEPNAIIDKPLIATKIYIKDKLRLDTHFIK